MIDKSCISTVTGRRFNPTTPEIKDITIEDIAHALSMICRANGHFKMFYSVAQHSINCAMEAKVRGLSKEIQLICLLHDASEAYIGDMTRPLKRQLTAYNEYEYIMQKTILGALEIPKIDEDGEKAVKEIDDSLLYHEFKLYNGDRLFEKEPELSITLPIEEIHHTKVKSQFISLYNALKYGKKRLLSVGIDGCKGQWIAAVLTNENVTVQKYKSIDDICREYHDADSMIIDMPIGLPDSKKMTELRPDNYLRKILKGKASSVFLNDNPKWKNRLREGHPEYGFSILNDGVPVMSKKRTDEGAIERMRLLERYCSGISETIKNQRHKDDVIDALCLAVIGRLGLENGCITVPKEMNKDIEGLEMGIMGVKIK